MATSTFQAIKLEMVSVLGLSKDALHVYVGLLVFFAVAVIFKRQLRSAVPIVSVLLVACIAEIVDARDDVSDLGYWRFAASVHDIVNTIVWPAVITVLARYTKMLR